MKSEKMIRVSLMLVGLGAGMLFAKPVFAQQDTDPVTFEMASATALPAQAGFNVASSPAVDLKAAAETAAPLVAQEQELVESGVTAVDTATMTALIAVVGLIALFGIAEAMGESRRRTWKEKASSAYPSGAIAN